MKLEIWEEEKKNNPVRLRLIDSEDGSGEIVLKAVDSEGDTIISGNILGILKDGTIKRKIKVNRSLGFKLDSEGRVKFNEPK